MVEKVPHFRNLFMNLVFCLILGFCIAKSEENLARGKSTYQSSTTNDGYSSKAVDGNKNSNFDDGSCTHTSDGFRTERYWYVDLGQQYHIGAVVIYNRMDCCSDRLTNTDVFVIPNEPVSGSMVDSQYLCGTIRLSTEDKAVEEVDCEGRQGRFVYIEKSFTSVPLTLCEVEVFKQKNLAKGKQTNQSSTFLEGFSSKAVDGNTSSNYFDNSCTHTQNISEQYLYVDLGAQYRISEVVTYNRMDCCSDRLKNTEVYVVPMKPISWNVDSQYLCGRIVFVPQNATEIEIQCGGRQGQYVFIRKTDTNYLTLCEVEVFKQRNLARGQFAWQGSADDNGIGSKAVDGNTNSDFHNGSCTLTEPSYGTTFYVSLGAEYLIDEVVIYNRMDCCSEQLSNTTVQILTGDFLDIYICAEITPSFLDVNPIVIQCNGTRGRHVEITKRETATFSLCEVEVYGRTLPEENN